MTGQLLALLANDVEDVSLAMLGHAIAHAHRRDGAVIHRAFVRSHRGRFVARQRPLSD